MKKFAIYTILLFNFFFFSCNSKKEKANNIISIFNLKSKKFQPKSVKMVPLQTTNSCLMSNNLKFIHTKDSNIYVGDFTPVNSKVFRFNYKGDFKNTIGSKGQGTKEYSTLTDFTISNDTIFILTNKGMISNIYCYLNNDKYIANMKVNISATSFEKNGSEYIFNTSYSPKSYTHRIYITNHKGKKTASFLPYTNKNFNMPITEYNFSNYNSSVLYRQSFDKFTYEYINNKLEKKYEIDFGKYTIPEEFYKGAFMKGLIELQKKGFGNIRCYFESSRYAVFEINIQKGMKDPILIEYIVLNKSTRKINRYSYTDQNNFFGKLVGLSINNELIFMTFPYQIIDNMDKFEKYPIINKDKLQHITLSDNPILFYYTLKNS